MSRRPTLPISLYVSRRKVLLVGTGPGADERAHRLSRADADLHRVAEADYDASCCVGMALVIANGTSSEHNAQVASDARRAGCLTYAHDQPSVSDFALPAVVRLNSLSIAIATDGTAPALARRFRKQLSAIFDTARHRLLPLLALMEEYRREHNPGPERTNSLHHMAARLHLRGTLDIDDS